MSKWSSSSGVPLRSKVTLPPVAVASMPVGAVMANSALSRPVTVNGTTTSAVRTALPVEDSATRKVTLASSSTLLPLGVCLVMVTAMASAAASLMVKVCGLEATVTLPVKEVPVFATRTSKVSSPSFSSSLTAATLMLPVRVLAVLMVMLPPEVLV